MFGAHREWHDLRVVSRAHVSTLKFTSSTYCILYTCTQRMIMYHGKDVKYNCSYKLPWRAVTNECLVT